MLLRCALLLSVAVTGCVEADGGPSTHDPGPLHASAGPNSAAPSARGPVPCATPSVERYRGAAARHNEYYPDNVGADVTWTRVDSIGCVDRYLPTGTAHYTYAVPGALCTQTLTPGDHAIGVDDGFLEVDRRTAPATYRGSGATTWAITWNCLQADGTVETQTFDGGGVWFDSDGVFTGLRVEGEHVEEDGRRCGRGQSTQPCTYTWAFDPQ